MYFQYVFLLWSNISHNFVEILFLNILMSNHLAHKHNNTEAQEDVVGDLWTYFMSLICIYFYFPHARSASFQRLFKSLIEGFILNTHSNIYLAEIYIMREFS